VEGVNENEIFTLIRNYLVEEFEVPEEKVDPEANLFTDLELDSIDTFDMVAMMENRFEIEIDDEALKEIRTIRDVVVYVLAHFSARCQTA